jgi:hypothetical protein
MMVLIDMAPEGRSGSLRELRRGVRLAYAVASKKDDREE